MARALASQVRSALVTLLALALGSCAADTVEEAEGLDPDALGELRQSVIGGTTATDCQWPSTVRVQSASQCTGTLIHPRVVTTAAHCISGTSASIGFGTRGAPGSFNLTARCVAGARGERGVNTASDWAYCILPEDPRVAKLPITPPLVGCEAALVTPGSAAWVVGYGITSPQGGGNGAKRQVEVKINAFDKRAPGTIDVGDRDNGACHGDSGGPLYVRVSRDGVDYGWRVAGSTSGPGAAVCDCTCSTTYVEIENHVKAIERDEGIDVTPCTDAAGNWQPSAGCAGFESAPQSGTGSYPQCSVARTTLPIQSCAAGPTTQADAGADAGSTPDAGAAGDAGALRDAGARADTGASSDAGFGLDASSSGAAPAIDAAAAQSDAAVAALADAGAATGDAGDAAQVSVAIDRGTTGLPQADAHDSGCSASRARGDFDLPTLTLLALAFARGRRRRHGASARV